MHSFIPLLGDFGTNKSIEEIESFIIEESMTYFKKRTIIDDVDWRLWNQLYDCLDKEKYKQDICHVIFASSDYMVNVQHVPLLEHLFDFSISLKNPYVVINVCRLALKTNYFPVSDDLLYCFCKELIPILTHRPSSIIYDFLSAKDFPWDRFPFDKYWPLIGTLYEPVFFLSPYSEKAFNMYKRTSNYKGFSNRYYSLTRHDIQKTYVTLSLDRTGFTILLGDRYVEQNLVLVNQCLDDHSDYKISRLTFVAEGPWKLHHKFMEQNLFYFPEEKLMSCLVCIDDAVEFVHKDLAERYFDALLPQMYLLPTSTLFLIFEDIVLAGRLSKQLLDVNDAPFDWFKSNVAKYATDNAQKRDLLCLRRPEVRKKSDEVNSLCLVQ